MTSRHAIHIATTAGEIEVIDEPAYTFGSADNVRSYPHAVQRSGAWLQYGATHGVLLNGEPLAVFGDYRTSAVHAKSVLSFGDFVHLAVGGLIVCFRPQPFEVLWQLDIDDAACFGIHDAAAHVTLISHGELSIARYSPDGRMLWQAYGADIFSEGFALKPECVEAVDFDGRLYRFSYATGESLP